MARVVTNGGGTEASLLLAMLLLVVGLGFKIAAVPFHMWTPDAYQGAPTPVSAYMSVIPKVAGFAAMVRILVEALGPLRDEWVTLVSILAVITMFFGNIVAIAQRDVKRMLGYSSIGQTGFILAGLAAYGATAGGDRSVTSVNYYLFAYAFMNIGAFAVVTWMQNRGYGTSIDDFNGLGTRSPMAALAMTVFMLSLMGFPPLVGFYAKYYVILACIEGNLTWLAVAIVLASAISAFFYLRVVAVMYFSEPTAGRWPARRRCSASVCLRWWPARCCWASSQATCWTWRSTGCGRFQWRCSVATPFTSPALRRAMRPDARSSP